MRFFVSAKTPQKWAQKVTTPEIWPEMGPEFVRIIWRLAVYKIGLGDQNLKFSILKILFPKIGKIRVLRFFAPAKIPQKWAQNVKTPENDRKFAGLIVCYMNRLAVYKIG